MKKRKNNSIENIVKIIVIVGLILLAIGCVSSFETKKDKDIPEDKVLINPSFSVGGLTTTGKYLETTKSIYTEDSFNALGLSVELNFESNIEYQVFWYDEDDVYLDKSTILTENKDFELPKFASKARIVISPNFDNVENANEEEIKWYQVTKYSNQMKIYVNKNQTINWEKVIYNQGSIALRNIQLNDDVINGNLYMNVSAVKDYCNAAEKVTNKTQYDNFVKNYGGDVYLELYNEFEVSSASNPNRVKLRLLHPSYTISQDGVYSLNGVYFGMFENGPAYIYYDMDIRTYLCGETLTTNSNYFHLMNGGKSTGWLQCLFNAHSLPSVSKEDLDLKLIDTYVQDLGTEENQNFVNRYFKFGY